MFFSVAKFMAHFGFRVLAKTYRMMAVMVDWQRGYQDPSEKETTVTTVSRDNLLGHGNATEKNQKKKNKK